MENQQRLFNVESMYADRPCLTMTCPKCGNIVSAQELKEDRFQDAADLEEFVMDLIFWAKRKYKIEVLESVKFKLGNCKCSH